MGLAESLSLLAAFVAGVAFTLAASVRARAAGVPMVQKSLEPQGEPLIGPPPGWKP